MTPSFFVRATSHFDRLMHRISRRHADLAERYEEALLILKSDLYNRSRRHAIIKLEGIAPDDGQYRLRLGRWRFRYDIHGQDVVLKRCSLRREDTYR